MGGAVIKRPLIGITVAFVLGEFITVYGKPFIGVTILFLLGYVIFKIITGDKIIFSLVVVFLSLVLGNYQMDHSMLYRSRSEQFAENEKVVVNGVVSKIEEKQSGFYCYLEKEAYFNGAILVVENADQINVGDKIQAAGKFRPFQIARNKGNFDEVSYYHSLGIFAKISEGNVIYSEPHNLVTRVLADIKKELKDSLYRICDDKEAGVFSGILLGDKNEISSEIKDLYKANGISHIISISGLHISIIGMSIYKLLRRILYMKPASAIAIIVTVAFGILTGSDSSTMRAVIMLSVSLGAKITGRSYDGISSLSLAVLLLLFSNPLYLYNSGFQLSVMAVLGVTIVYPIVSDFLNINRKITRSILFSICISIVTMPILAWNYFELPTYSTAINLLIIPFMNISVVSGFAGCLLGLLQSVMGKIGILAGVYVLKLYEFICNLFIKIPASMIVVGKPTILKLYIYYSTLMVILIIMKIYLIKRNKQEEKDIEWWWIRYSKNIFACTVMCIFILIIYKKGSYGFEITFLDVGQGDGIYIHSEKSVFTIDGGSSSVTEVGKYRIAPFLKANGIGQIDYAIITHCDSDHYNGIMELLKEKSNTITIRNLVMADISKKDAIYMEIVETAIKNNVNVLYVSAGMVIKQDNLSMEVLHPAKDYNSLSLNDGSLTIKLKYNDFTGIFTGDLEESGEQRLLEDNKLVSCYLLKVAHHGSKNSTSQQFLEKLKPKLSIISAGEHNLYGHPHKELLERLRQVQTNILGTYDYGSISLMIEKHDLRIVPYINKMIN